MKKLFILGMFIFVGFACKKNTNSEIQIATSELQTVAEPIYSSKWGINDDKYLASIRRFKKGFKFTNAASRTAVSCTSGGADSTYGFYDDPEDLVVEGSYVKASTTTLEIMLPLVIL